jgi:replicative DNA helicase
MSDDDFAEPIHDIEAEQYTLSAMMAHPAAIEAAVEILAPESFYRPAHRVLFRAMVLMMAAGERIDPMTLRAYLEQTGEAQVLGGKGSLYLVELMECHAMSASAEHYATVVLRCAARRTVQETGVRLIAEAGRLDLNEAELVARSHYALDRVLTTGAPSSVDMHDQTCDDVCDAVLAHPVPVIPGLLDPMDRAIVVGPEGSGKSMLGWQVGFAAAAGSHPFQPEIVIPTRRVLVADLENPPVLVSRRWRMLRERARGYQRWDSKNISLLHRPGGLDLTSARDAYGFGQLVARREPDLIVAGPIYKMIMGASGDDKMAAYDRLSAFFDKLRERHGCAIWLEAHAPYGNAGKREYRPEGSNLWAKWPEFGLSLNWGTVAHDGRNGGLDVSQFRGHRDEGRPWPIWLQRNHDPSGWPWQAHYDQHVAPPSQRYEGEGDS